ncbi:AI-2E family transporter [Lysinibacillus sp. KU-BSD001]|uniref:AI-2E family transporter n=1 Tax=Lysinibacillus sp. KU-BSD001 TaxID=3141328 RepID=UPI0036EE0981
MNNFFAFSYESTKKFLLLLLYLALLIFLSPITLGIFCATLFYPFLLFFYKKLKIPYVIVVLITTISFFYGLYWLIRFMIDSFMLIFPQLQDMVSSDIFSHPILKALLESGLSAIDQIATISINATREIFSYLFEMIIFIMAFYFALFESKRDRYWFFVYTPTSVRETWKSYFKSAMSIFTTFLYVEVRLIALTFLLLALGFWLLGFSYPLPKAFFIALADCLPFFGIGFVLVPLAIYFYIVEEVILCIAVVILYIFIQTTRQLTESFLWASTFHVRTVHSFFISAASVLLFGFYGILLSPFFLLIAVKLREKSIFGR